MMDADHRDGRHKGQNLSAVKVLTRFILSHCNSRNGVCRVELNDNDIRGFQARS